MKKTIIIFLFAILAGCSALPISSSGNYTGYYINSFETSAFATCEMLATSDFNQSYWLSASAESGFFAKLSQITIPSTPGVTPVPYSTFKKVYVKFEGTLSSPGQYGHLGQYPREITVTKLLEMAAATDTQCG